MVAGKWTQPRVVRLLDWDQIQNSGENTIRTFPRAHGGSQLTRPVALVFRLIRLYKTVSREEMETVWKVDNEETQYDVSDRLNEGRGVLGLVDKDLPAAIKALNED